MKEKIIVIKDRVQVPVLEDGANTPLVQYAKTLAHGLVIPILLGILFKHYTDLSGAYALFYGGLYLLVPAWIYHEQIRPEPIGFFILATIHSFMICIVSAMEGGPYHVL